MAISLGLHAAVLVVPIRGGHYLPAKWGASILQVSLPSEEAALPVADLLPEVDMTDKPDQPPWPVIETRGASSSPPEGPQPEAGFFRVPETPKPIYFTARELHLRPSPIGTVLHEEAGRIYPDSSTHLLIQINEQGRVDHAEILAANNEKQAREALQAFSGARYIPGAIAGRKVKSELRVEVISSQNLVFLREPAN